MCKKYLLAAVILMLSFVNVYSEKVWNDGVVVLKDHTVINGQLLFDSYLNIVQVSSENKVKAFSASQVAMFYLNDGEIGFIRKFVSKPFEVRSRIFTDMFFEEIIKGDISLLRKQNGGRSFVSLRENLHTNNSFVIDDQQYTNAMDYDYFFEAEGKVVPAARFSKDLMPGLMERYNSEKVNTYIDSRKLNVDKLYDQIAIVKFCNELKPSKQSILNYL